MKTSRKVVLRCKKEKCHVYREISHLIGDDRDDFLEELEDDEESSVPELEVAPESQLEEEGSIKD